MSTTYQQYLESLNTQNSVVTNAVALDYTKVTPGYSLLKWEDTADGYKAVEMTEAEVATALKNPDQLWPRFIDFWLTEEGKNDPKPMRLEREDHAHSAATAWAAAAVHSLYSISEGAVLLSNPHLDDSGAKTSGYLFPGYRGDLVMGGMAIVGRSTVRPDGLTPITRNEITRGYELGREFVPGWDWANFNKEKEGATERSIKAAQNWCQHANAAISKYWLLRDMIVHNQCLRVSIKSSKNWAYAAEVLNGSMEANNPEEAIDLIMRHVEAKKEGARVYQERKADPAKAEAVAGKIAKAGTDNEFWTTKELNDIVPQTVVRIWTTRKSGCDMAKKRWSGNMAENQKEILSYFAVEGCKYALQIIR